MQKEIYYENQKEWNSDKWLLLYRFLCRMIKYKDTTKGSYDGKKRIEEIKSINLCKMSEETKVLLYCIIIDYNCLELLNLNNLKNLKKVNPLNNPLIINYSCINQHFIYKKFNIISKEGC